MPTSSHQEKAQESFGGHHPQETFPVDGMDKTEPGGCSSKSVPQHGEGYCDEPRDVRFPHGSALPWTAIKVHGSLGSFGSDADNLIEYCITFRNNLLEVTKLSMGNYFSLQGICFTKYNQWQCFSTSFLPLFYTSFIS